MKSFAVLSVLVAIAAQAAALTINTPASIVQCEPVQFSWDTTGTPPYFLSLLPGGQPTAAALKTFPETSDTTYTWIADLQGGTSITPALRDSTGNQVFAQQVTIQTSSNSTCLNTAVAEGGSSGDDSSSSTPAGGAATTAGGSTTTSSGVSPGSTTKSSSTKSSSTSSGATGAATTGSSNSNGASRGSPMGAFGIAGVMGLVGAALL